MGTFYGQKQFTPSFTSWTRTTAALLWELLSWSFDFQQHGGFYPGLLFLIPGEIMTFFGDCSLSRILLDVTRLLFVVFIPGKVLTSFSGSWPFTATVVQKCCFKMPLQITRLMLPVMLSHIQPLFWYSIILWTCKIWMMLV